MSDIARRFRARRGKRFGGGLAGAVVALASVFVLAHPEIAPTIAAAGPALVLLAWLAKLVLVGFVLLGGYVAWRAVAGPAYMEVGPSGFVFEGALRRNRFPWARINGHERDGDHRISFGVPGGRLVVDDDDYLPEDGSASKAAFEVYRRWCK